MVRAARAMIVLGLVLLGGSCVVRVAHAEPTTEAGLWRAAGVVRFTRAVEAPDFELRDLKGRLVSLREFNGRVVLLYFWTTW